MSAPIKLKSLPDVAKNDPGNELEKLRDAAQNLSAEANKPAPAKDLAAKRIADSLGKVVEQLLRDKKTRDLPGRSSAVVTVYKSFNKAVDDYNDGVKERKEAEAAGKEAKPAPIPSSPDKVKLLINGVKGPTAWKDDYDDLLALMKKPGNYDYTGKGTGGSWTPDFRQHKSHTDSGTKGWKAYVEQPSMGAGSKWRLYFTCNDYDTESGELTVKLIKCKEDH